MVGNIGIGIANAIGFKHIISKGGGGGGSISYPGLIAAWSAKGKSNDDEDRATLKDLTGNGHDITLNGFAFSEMSGYGGYGTLDVNTWHKYANSTYNRINVNKIEIISSSTLFTQIRLNGDKCILKFNKINVVKAIQGCSFTTEDGYIYKITKNIETAYRIDINSEYINVPIIVESLPLYPDALVFDGIDDYGINEDMPIQDDFTLIVKRDYLQTERNSCLFSKSSEVGLGAFIMEIIQGNSYSTLNYSYNKSSSFTLHKPLISYLTSNSYNGAKIVKGETFDTSMIYIGTIRPNDSLGRYFQGAFYSAYLFDRSLDEQEIKAFIRKYIDAEYSLPSEIPTPDCYYDFSQGSNDDETRDTIKDLSGNGNDAVAHNFAWNEEGSGYKDGALYFDGVDDYVSLDAFDSGFKTVFMVCNVIDDKPNMILYDQRKTSNYFAIYTGGSIAYNARNDEGITYINGYLNNSIHPYDLANKKHLITILNNNVTENLTRQPIIGTSSNTSLISHMALYKFLGFKEALTEEQINAIIKKYNLLDGVDEIEVS